MQQDLAPSTTRNTRARQGHAPALPEDAPAPPAQGLPNPRLTAAGWHEGSGIQTLTGLAGTFQWNETPFQFRRINFRFDPGQEGAQGMYSISGMWGPLEQGRFACAVQHPLLGQAVIGLYPNGQAAAGRLFLIAGLFSDANWKIFIMSLNRLGNQGSMGPTFSALRIF